MRKPLLLVLPVLVLAACSDQLGPPDPLIPADPSDLVNDADQGSMVNPFAHLLPPVGDPFDASPLTPATTDLLPFLRVRVVCWEVVDAAGDEIASPDPACDPSVAVQTLTAANDGVMRGSGAAIYHANIDLRELLPSPDGNGNSRVYRAIAELSFFPQLGWQEVASADFMALANGNAKKNTSGEGSTIETAAAQLPFKIFAEEGIAEEALSDAIETADLSGDPELEGACQLRDSSGRPICSLTFIPVDQTTEASLSEDGNELAAILFNETQPDLQTPAVLLLSKLADEHCALGRIPSGMTWGNCVAAVMFPEQLLGDHDGDGEVVFSEGEGVPGGVCGILDDPAARTVKFDHDQTPAFSLPPRVDVTRFLTCETTFGFLDDPVRWLAHRTADLLVTPLYARDLKGTQLRDLSHLIELVAVEMAKQSGDGAATVGQPHDLVVHFAFDHVDGATDLSAPGRTATFTATGGGTFSNQQTSIQATSGADGLATVQFYPADGANQITVTSDDALPVEGLVFTVTGETGAPIDVIDFETYQGAPSSGYDLPEPVTNQYAQDGATFTFGPAPGQGATNGVRLCAEPGNPTNHGITGSTTDCVSFPYGELRIYATGLNTSIGFDLIRPTSAAVPQVYYGATGPAALSCNVTDSGQRRVIHCDIVGDPGTVVEEVLVIWSGDWMFLDDLAVSPPVIE